MTTLRAIKTAQCLGFSLDEAAELIEVGYHRGRGDGLQPRTETKFAEVDQKIADLYLVRESLIARETGCDDLVQCAAAQCCPIQFVQITTPARIEPPHEPQGSPPPPRCGAAACAACCAAPLLVLPGVAGAGRDVRHLRLHRSPVRTGHCGRNDIGRVDPTVQAPPGGLCPRVGSGTSRPALLSPRLPSASGHPTALEVLVWPTSLESGAAEPRQWLDSRGTGRASDVLREFNLSGNGRVTSSRESFHKMLGSSGETPRVGDVVDPVLMLAGLVDSLPQAGSEAVNAEPAGLLPARQQMALSLGWHIILACFGVAFPAMIFAMHLIGIRRKNPAALLLARKWAKVSAVLFAIGAVSGTVLSFEMGLLWPGLMGTFGDVLGLPFAFEGLAFFVEAIFLGIYLYGWDRMPPKKHLLMVLPMAITGVIGTFCVIAVNAWMNAPVGFDLVDGEVRNVEPWSVLLNPDAFWQFLHMWVAAYMVAGFAIASVYAVGMLRGRRDRAHRLGFTLAFAFASVSAVLQPVVGHLLGSRLAETQPAKLAAFELATETESPSPLRLGGLLVDGEVRWSIDIPYLGSLIARNSFTKPVEGLSSFPVQNRPPVNITHLAFQSMVGIGTLLALAVVVFWVARWRGTDLLEHRWFLRFAAVFGVLAVVAMEAGWIATEVGRQPWIVYGVMRTPEAAGENSGLWWLLAATAVVYTLMTIGAVIVLRSMARRWRFGEVDLPSPYGPQEQQPHGSAAPVSTKARR